MERLSILQFLLVIALLSLANCNVLSDTYDFYEQVSIATKGKMFVAPLMDFKLYRKDDRIVFSLEHTSKIYTKGIDSRIMLEKTYRTSGGSFISKWRPLSSTPISKGSLVIRKYQRSVPIKEFENPNIYGCDFNKVADHEQMQKCQGVMGFYHRSQITNPTPTNKDYWDTIYSKSMIKYNFKLCIRYDLEAQVVQSLNVQTKSGKLKCQECDGKENCDNCEMDARLAIENVICHQDDSRQDCKNRLGVENGQNSFTYGKYAHIFFKLNINTRHLYFYTVSVETNFGGLANKVGDRENGYKVEIDKGCQSDADHPGNKVKGEYYMKFFVAGPASQFMSGQEGTLLKMNFYFRVQALANLPAKKKILGRNS